MRRVFTIALLCGLAGVAALVSAQTSAGRTLDIYYIDTEGGQSTLFVTPTGESLLVDTGNAGARDLDRIVAALAAAGVKQIDHMWTTHYHGDHVGAMEELAKRVPMKHFYDHGPMAANDRATPATFLPIYEALSKGHRTTVKPGDKLPMGAWTSPRCRRTRWELRPICPARASRIRRARASRRRMKARTSIRTTDPRPASR